MKPSSISPDHSFTSKFCAQKYKLKRFFRQIMALVAVSSVGILTSLSVNASIWIDTEDSYLKASIRALANGGVIKTPINTYPLLYKSIMADNKSAQNNKIAPHLQFALQYVEHAIQHSKVEHKTGIKL
jgi:hypothetical protein